MTGCTRIPTGNYDETQPLCGACGSRHAEGRGVCDLDPMSVPPPDPSDEEQALWEALFTLNQAISATKASSRVPDTAYQRLERVRDEVWDLGLALYGWCD